MSMIYPEEINKSNDGNSALKCSSPYYNKVDVRPVSVSILCTTYNHENYIADALSSFIDQKTNFRYEIIVCDDASTDNTAAIIRQFEIKYPYIIRAIYLNINLYSQGKSKMPIYNKIVQGKYVAMCEGDDYWIDPLKLQKQYDYMETHPNCSLCIHNAYRVNTNREVVGAVRPTVVNRIITTDEVLYGGGGFCATSSIFTLRALMFDSNSCFNIFPLDVVLQASLACKGNTYCFSDFMSVYRVGVEGSWTSRMNESSLERVRYMCKLNEVFNVLDKDTNYRWHQIIMDLNNEREITVACLQGDFLSLFNSEYLETLRRMNFKARNKVVRKMLIAILQFVRDRYLKLLLPLVFLYIC